MRFFYLPNEHALGSQLGPRKAFERLAAAGVLSAYEAYSYLIERQKYSSQEEALSALAAAVRAFDPDVVFWQHIPSYYVVEEGFIRRLKSDHPRMRFIYHEGDPWDRVIKRFSSTMRAAFAHSDLAALVGIGYLADMVRECGAKQVVISPHSYDTIRFGKAWTPTDLQRRWDVVMIANLTCIKRIPFLFMPGGASRKRLAWALHEELGERFALFGTGQGWKGAPFCKGTLDFAKQDEIIRSSWISANWGQFDKIGYYGSDRLPIALSCGVPHITNYQPGYEHLYGDCPGLYWFKTVNEAIDIVRFLLSQPRARLNELGAGGAEFAARRLNADVVYAELVAVIRERLFPDQDGSPALQREIAGETLR